MNPEELLIGLRKRIEPRADLQAKILRSVQSRTHAKSTLFARLRHDITPSRSSQEMIWNRIATHMELPQASTFTRIRIALQPSPALREQIKARVLLSLQPVTTAAVLPQIFKWTAAFAVFGIFMRMTPFLFMASSTVAESAATLIPTQGEVSVSIGGLWQPLTDALAVEPGMMIRTRDGEASIILHDDGVVRLGPNTAVQLQSLTDRLEPDAVSTPILTLFTGKIWMQGLVPPQLPGLTVATSFGQVQVNEGSVLITEDDVVNVEVYDRSATVYNNGDPVFLSSGERTELSANNVLLVKKIPAKWYQYTWANQNLNRDAVHRHDIAQAQHERRIVNAGILPTSPLYPVKRFAEVADMWMTIGAQSRVEKQLAQAETRLNEAAALISSGEEATTTLDEYKQTLLAIADGQNHGSLAEYLVQRAMMESTAQMAAVLPGDDSYVIKKTVLEAGVDFPGDMAHNEDAQSTLLLDGLAAMLKAADEGHSDLVSAVWSDLQPYMSIMEDPGFAMDPSMHKEANTLLSFLATALQTASTRGADIDPELLSDISIFLPAPTEPSSVAMSDAEVQQIAQEIRDKIFIYNLAQARINQFFAEVKALHGHPEEGRILRKLASILPDGPEEFPKRVYKEVVRLRWETVGDVI